MIEKTFTYNGATITCTRATVRSRLQTNWIYSHFVAEDTAALDMYTYTVFARFMTQCAITGDLGFEVPGIGADKETMQAALDAFLDQPAEFHDVLVAALNEADAALPKKTQTESLTPS